MIPVSIGNVLLEKLIKVFSKPFTLISPAWSWEQEELLRWDKKYFLTHLLMKFQEPCSHCSLLRVFHPTEVIFHQCQIDLMISLHQIPLAFKPSLTAIFFTKSVRFSSFVLQYYSATYVQRWHWKSKLLLLTCIFQQYCYKFKSIFYK